MSDIVIRAVTSASPVIKPSNAPGPQGGVGPTGDDGTDGNTWYSGSSDPSDESGVDGDFYLNTTSWDVFKKISGEWSLQGNIKGASGDGSGDVSGPEVSTDAHIAVFDGETGKVIKDSGKAIADLEFNVVDDTTPQLGGNLDVNGKKIISASNGDIPLAPNGSGMVKMEKGVYFSDYISNGTDSCTIDWRASNKQLITPSGDRTYTFTAPTGVTSLTLVITVTASRTLYWPAAVSWRGGAPATTAAGTYIATFFWDGTNYFGTCTGKD